MGCEQRRERRVLGGRCPGCCRHEAVMGVLELGGQVRASDDIIHVCTEENVDIKGKGRLSMGLPTVLYVYGTILSCTCYTTVPLPIHDEHKTSRRAKHGFHRITGGTNQQPGPVCDVPTTLHHNYEKIFVS